VLESPENLPLILSQVENRGNQNSRRRGLVKDAIWKSLHHLSALRLKLSSAILCCHMPSAKPVQLKRPISFDEAMRRTVKVLPPLSGKKAKLEENA